MKNFKKYLVLALSFGLGLNSINANQYKKPFRDAIKNQKKDDALKALIELHKNYPNNKDFPDKFKKAFNQTFEDALVELERTKEEANRKATIIRTEAKKDNADNDVIKNVELRLNTDELLAIRDERSLDIFKELVESYTEFQNIGEEDDDNEDDIVIQLLESIINAELHHFTISSDVKSAQEKILRHEKCSGIIEALKKIRLRIQQSWYTAGLKAGLKEGRSNRNQAQPHYNNEESDDEEEIEESE